MCVYVEEKRTETIWQTKKKASTIHSQPTKQPNDQTNKQINREKPMKYSILTINNEGKCFGEIRLAQHRNDDIANQKKNQQKNKSISIGIGWEIETKMKRKEKSVLKQIITQT